MLTRLLVLGCVFSALWATFAAGQGSKSAPVSQLAVDVVSLKSGKTLRGAVVRQEPQAALAIAVSREWLRLALPDVAQKAVSQEAEQRKQVGEQLRGRLVKRLETPPAEPRLAFFLKQELERVESQLASEVPPEPPQFLWMELERDAIAKVILAPPDRRRVAQWAWSERLPHVETRDLQDLQRELKSRKIDPTAVGPDLSDRLAPRLQDEREWAARLAIVEYVYAKPIDFQGTGDLLVRSDVERKGLDLAPVLSKVLQSQVDSLLKELTGESRSSATADSGDDWLKSATKEADLAGMRGLRATRVEVKVDGGHAFVQTAFAARMPNGKWEMVWSHRESQDAIKPRAEAEAKIAGDPQIKQALDAIKSLGVGADDQIRHAIRFGAATMAAQQAADARFFEFRDRYVTRLDGPPLIWSK